MHVHINTHVCIYVCLLIDEYFLQLTESMRKNNFNNRLPCPRTTQELSYKYIHIHKCEYVCIYCSCLRVITHTVWPVRGKYYQY